MWETIAGAKRYSRPRGFNIVGASAPVAPAVPTPLSLVAGFCRRGVGHFTSAASPASLFIVYTVQHHMPLYDIANREGKCAENYSK